MKQNQASQSAMGVALFREIEMQKPESDRICADTYAHVFVPGGFLTTLTKWMVSSGLYDRLAPGAISFVVVRERYIDDFLKKELAEGLDQVVLLGAGFDSRAYRIPGIEKTRVFEIDHPATQAVKIERLKKAIDPLPDHVTFVPVDFNTQSLDECLISSGYSENARTVFIWQGVTYFLSKESVDSTLAFISAHSGPGSVVIFDYFYNETLHDPSRTDVKMMQRTARALGEAYMFGIDRGQLEAFLTSRGFKDIHNADLIDLKQIYFTGSNSKRTISDGIAIASAAVDIA